MPPRPQFVLSPGQEGCSCMPNIVQSYIRLYFENSIKPQVQFTQHMIACTCWQAECVHYSEQEGEYKTPITVYTTYDSSVALFGIWQAVHLPDLNSSYLCPRLLHTTSLNANEEKKHIKSALFGPKYLHQICTFKFADKPDLNSSYLCSWRLHTKAWHAIQMQIKLFWWCQSCSIIMSCYITRQIIIIMLCFAVCTLWEVRSPDGGLLNTSNEYFDHQLIFIFPIY